MYCKNTLFMSLLYKLFFIVNHNNENNVQNHKKCKELKIDALLCSSIIIENKVTITKAISYLLEKYVLRQC